MSSHLILSVKYFYPSAPIISTTPPMYSAKQNATFSAEGFYSALPDIIKNPGNK